MKIIKILEKRTESEEKARKKNNVVIKGANFETKIGEKRSGGLYPEGVGGGNTNGKCKGYRN